MSPLAKLYTWSIVLEPMLFFIVTPHTVSGVGGNVSRLLQFIVLLNLLLRASSGAVAVRAIHPMNRLYANYSLYFLLACVSGIYGYASGAFTMPLAYKDETSAFAAAFNAPWIRPFFEYWITLYYFVYFAILPRLILKSAKDVSYFFTTFFFMFNASLVVGYFDYAFTWVGLDLVGRHITDWREVGQRFHGLAGEPRDAFAFLIFGLALYYVRACAEGTRINPWWVCAVGVAALLTQSGSGLIGLVVSLVLLVLIGVMRLNKFTLALAGVAVLVGIPVIYLVIENTPRLFAYKELLLGLWDILERHDDVPLLLTGQMNNIYPLYQLVVSTRELDLLPLLLGSGLGSASAINNLLGTWGGLTNPHSQLVRLIYESGIIGSVFFVFAFYKPIERFAASMPIGQRRRLLALMLLLIGAFMGHRNAGLYIFLGICIAVLGGRSRAADASALRTQPVEKLPYARPPVPGY